METALLLLLASATASMHPWPALAPDAETVHFEQVAGRVLSRDLYDSAGRPRYRLNCKSGDLEDDITFNYSGLFHCRLSPITSYDRLASLLWEDRNATSDWDGRARFLLDEVVGVCGRTPDWGARRTFKLRGFALTLAITNVVLERSAAGRDAKSFDFSYRVRPDATAKRDIAAHAATPEPPWFQRPNDCIKER